MKIQVAVTIDAGPVKCEHCRWVTATVGASRKGTTGELRGAVAAAGVPAVCGLYGSVPLPVVDGAYARIAPCLQGQIKG